MKRLAGMLLLLTPAFLYAQQSGHHGAPKYAPENGQQLLILGQDLGSVGGLDAYDSGYVDLLNHVPAGVTTYTGFPGLGGLEIKDNWGAGDVHAEAYINDSTFNNSFIVIGLHIVDQLGSIINGYSDFSIAALGEWIKAQNRPVFLRIGYEFDGSWNHYDPEDYVAAWKYIVHHFDDLDIRNVSYVWQAAGTNTLNISKWYPGDSYVNWVGYSHFDEPNPGQNIIDFAETHDKPIMIAEASPKVDLKTGSGEDHWTNWYEPLFDRIYDNNRIKALAYINAEWENQPMWTGQGWGDSRVQVNDAVKSNWQTEILKDSWVLASDRLFELLNFNMWQDSVSNKVEYHRSQKEQITVINDTYKMLVRSSSGGLLNGIRIWD
ncbi:MAG: hypothetical protein KAT15_21500, partial [Bacteroidales bacterium]|nr:hypothetical protein [Bacteroidales bacterium]